MPLDVSRTRAVLKAAVDAGKVSVDDLRSFSKSRPGPEPSPVWMKAIMPAILEDGLEIDGNFQGVTQIAASLLRDVFDTSPRMPAPGPSKTAQPLPVPSAQSLWPTELSAPEGQVVMMIAEMFRLPAVKSVGQDRTNAEILIELSPHSAVSELVAGKEYADISATTRQGVAALVAKNAEALKGTNWSVRVNERPEDLALAVTGRLSQQFPKAYTNLLVRNEALVVVVAKGTSASQRDEIKAEVTRLRDIYPAYFALPGISKNVEIREVG